MTVENTEASVWLMAVYTCPPVCMSARQAPTSIAQLAGQQTLGAHSGSILCGDPSFCQSSTTRNRQRA